jgi:hypothetical protein
MRAIGTALILALAPAGWAAQLKPATAQAFEIYINEMEQRLAGRSSFLWVDGSPEHAQAARQGRIVVEPSGPQAITDVPDGMVHDWVGTIFLEGVSLNRTLAQIQDYDHHKDLYKPEVMDSRILSHSGNDFRVFMRLRKKQVITVVLDTEHDVHYIPVDRTHWRSVSKTTRISEVENPGKRDERDLPPGTGEGFLWRLYTYWRFQERDGGTWVECRAISLTRDVPLGLGFVIEPIIRNLPKDSVENTLKCTREALTAN